MFDIENWEWLLLNNKASILKRPLNPNRGSVCVCMYVCMYVYVYVYIGSWSTKNHP